MKKLLAILLLLAGPAWADDDDLPQFPKVAPPDPVPDAVCDAVAQPLKWALGDWAGGSLRLHVDGAAWTLSGLVTQSGTSPQIEPCGLTLGETTPILAAVRDEEGRMYAVLWTGSGKPRRLILVKQTGN